MGSYIKAISYQLPSIVVTNDDLCAIDPSQTVEGIFKKTGIRKRRIAAKGELASDIAVIAAEKLFAEHYIDKAEIDFVIFCSECFDYIAPATACIIQHRLGLKNNCGALDVGLGCTGFTYCLSLAKGLIESNQCKNILVLTADTASVGIHEKDIDLRMIFGDAAAATLVSYTDDSDKKIGKYIFGTDGTGAEHLVMKRSSMRNPIDMAWLIENEEGGGLPHGRMYMDALEVFNFSLKRVPPLICDILESNELEKEKVDLYIFHQANAFLLSVLRRKLKIEEDKFFMFIENVGNTVSSSIPIALCEAIKTGKAKKGDNILIAGFGIGYSWSGTIIKL